MSAAPEWDASDPGSYDGIDHAMLERSDSTFPPPAPNDPEPDAWLEAPPLISMDRWLDESSERRCDPIEDEIDAGQEVGAVVVIA